MIEASSFNVFGLTITMDDVNQMRGDFIKTYHELAKENKKWSNADFCRTQLATLWDSISSFMDRSISERELKEVDAEYLHKNLILNTENEGFLDKLAECSEKTAELLFSKLKKIETGYGSVHIGFQDAQTGESRHAVIDLQKIQRYFRRYSVRVRNSLKQFVDWVMLNRRTIVTCVLAAGITTITIFAALWAGASAIPLAKPVIVLIIAIICAIAENIALFESTEEFLRGLERFRGISFI